MKLILITTILADFTKVGNNEHSYYKLINCLLKNYFTDNKGFLVEMQSKEGKGIIDGSVTIVDPRSWEVVKPCLGLQGDFGKRDSKDFFHNINCLMEAKREHDSANKSASLIKILGQLKRYHDSSERNINAFSIAIRGFEITFFMYIHNWHYSAKFFNKGSDWNGFLCI